MTGLGHNPNASFALARPVPPGADIARDLVKFAQDA
jgi:hypothetical protein